MKENKDDVILSAKTLIDHEQITGEEIDYLMANRHLKRDEKPAAVEFPEPNKEEPKVEENK